MTKDESVRKQMFASIASWQASDLSQKEWCRQQKIAYHVFHYWYRVYRTEHAEPVNESPFVRLTMKTEANACCEVVFSDGTKVIFREPVSIQYLKSLLF
jgi:hypothetical protein